MCDYCENAKWKNIRMTLAAEAIGNFSAQATEDSPEGIEPFVQAAVDKFTDMIQATSPSPVCGQLCGQLVEGITRAWPKLTVEEKFRMALASGAIRM